MGAMTSNLMTLATKLRFSAPSVVMMSVVFFIVILSAVMFNVFKLCVVVLHYAAATLAILKSFYP
jgi:hypothetical protein